jgi:glycosyltransferase involved in cell wall biosynthesis
MTTYLPAALAAARAEGVPVISYVGEIFNQRHTRGLGRAAGSRLLPRYVERRSDALICCSRTVASQFRGSGDTILATSYPPIDVRYSVGNGDSFRRRYRLERAWPLLGVVGNITSARGQDLVVRALTAVRKEFPAAMAAIAGEPHTDQKDEPFRRELASLVESLQLTDSVVFPGFIDPVADLYAAADIVINPARFDEPFGRVAFEALTAGRPVVATKVGAIPEVLRDEGDALLVPPDDPAAIAAAVIRLARDRALRDRLVDAGRRRVATALSGERALEQFREISSAVLKRHGSGPLPRACSNA